MMLNIVRLLIEGENMMPRLLISPIYGVTFRSSAKTTSTSIR